MTPPSATSSVAAGATTSSWAGSGIPLPAAGFALYLERVHVAQAEEERLLPEPGEERP